MSRDSRRESHRAPSQVFASLREGHKIELRRLDAPEREPCDAVVLELREDSLFTVQAEDPLWPVDVAVAETIEVRASQADGTVFVVKAAVEQVTGGGMLLRRASQRQQRAFQRQFVRLNERLAVVFTVPVTMMDGEMMLEGFTIDISAGGLRARMMHGERPLTLKANLTVRLEFTLPDESAPFSCEARIVRSVNDEQGRMDLAVEYIDLPQRDRDRIFRHIFRRQAELRRRGLL